jgi:hypothetical protein
LDLEAIASEDNSTDNEEQESDGASYPYYYIYLTSLDLIGGFIDDETPIASGSGTQEHTSWNTLQNSDDLNDFFDRIYERSRSRRIRPTVEDNTDPHEIIRSLPGAEDFPLWRIACRVRL